MTILERFLTYVSYDTQSDPDSNTYPSTLKQHKLGEELVRELKELGIDNAYKDEYGYVYAILEGEMNKKIGLISHMDTATELSGKNVKPRIIDKYDGKDIILPNQMIISPKDFPFLNDLIGDTLVTTSGDTLLGADDKAGIAIIMSILDELIKSNKPHPTIYVAFTPDEEIGRGTAHFNYDFFKVDFAYTLDGAAIDNIDYENFNAASLKVTIKGNSIHPGEAKGKLINSQELAFKFHSLLPTNEKPEYTEKYEGFFHLTNMNGEVENTVLKYIIRDHDTDRFNQRKEFVKGLSNKLNQELGGEYIQIEIKDSYYNMADLIKPHPEIIDIPKKALAMYNIKAKSEPIRGGTDGAMLSYGGILCPNLGTGSYNHHGARELASITKMTLLKDILVTMFTTSELF